jgi:hypothetical protein
MISRVLRILVFGAMLALPLTAFAQEATLSGTVMDSTSSVLPGVTITALHQATGNRFVAVTDGQPRYSRDSIAEFSMFAGTEPWRASMMPMQLAQLNDTFLSHRNSPPAFKSWRPFASYDRL